MITPELDSDLYEDNLKTISVKLARRLGLPQQTAYECVHTVFAIISGSMRAGSRVSIRSFGSFEVRTRKPKRKQKFVPEENRFVVTKPKKVVFFKSKMQI